jgi:hypothetical protein
VATHVNVDNFVRAESDRMFAALAQDVGVNELVHRREPASVDDQRVIRQNRDTLYSSAIVDISNGATLSVPDAGDRYLSVMVVNNDHYINDVLHTAGEHPLTVDRFDTDYVAVASRILVDPNDPADLGAVHTLQDQLAVHAASARPFVLPEYDPASFDATRQTLLTLARGLTSFDGAFGAKAAVDPIHHLLGTAAGWGGLPVEEAFYIGVEPRLPVGEYKVTVRDVPVDGFWSISLYNADGFFEPNDRDAYSVNNITATPDPDGSVTVHFGGCADDRPNCLPIMEGWNYTVRMYRPRPEVVDGSWSFPSAEPA